MALRRPPEHGHLQWGTAEADMNFPSTENSELSKVLHLKPTVDQNIVLLVNYPLTGSQNVVARLQEIFEPRNTIYSL